MQSLMCDVCSFQNLGLISMTVADCVDMSNEFGLSSSCGQFGKCKDDADLYDNQFQGCICDSGFAGHRCDQESLKQEKQDRMIMFLSIGVGAAGLCAILAICTGFALRNQKRSKPYNFEEELEVIKL
eukprot:m.319418 g.319418  ORF g.319418 m.319418 type:complete len:127 (+) comp16517_c0_seq58:1683-2063(+)